MEPQSPGVPLVLLDNPSLAPVHVSAGGVNYTTTLTTLTRCPESKLAKLFNGTLPILLDPVNHHYFLDMDGQVFTHVLNYLRYGKLLLPHNFDQLPLLLEQAEQLELTSLIEELTTAEAKKNEDNSESSETDESVSSNSFVKTRPKRRRGKRARRGRDEVDSFLKRLEEGIQGLIKDLELMVKKKKEEEDALAMNIGYNLQTLIVDNRRIMDTFMKEHEVKNKKNEESMANTIKSFEECLHGLLVENKSTMKEIIMENEGRKQKEDERMDNLLKSLKECIQSILVDNATTMDKIIKDNADKRKLEDERIENLLKKFGDSFQELLNGNERKIEMKIKECDDYKETDGKEINKMMKSLEECFRKLLDDNEKKQNCQIVRSLAVSPGVVTVSVKFIQSHKYPSTEWVFMYEINVFSYPDKPQLIHPSYASLKPSPTEDEVMAGHYTWIYQKWNGRETCRAEDWNKNNISNDVANIISQLITQGYQLITAPSSLDPPYSLVFIRYPK